ncbi:SARP family transcriptional regulator [Lentzea pudingi]|uniref:SARP family transcriptional regulator n=1 Tax=Lentzea pudingi TaxID=1789439 RepID=A0ABQ2IT03_9PSEU|nr:BTAD domain-containing putative transcriptional regulator [Lentzea pudingi]GGN25330.1 SARP family transcriptional regulator [Lentzea pudingi]
MEFRVLGPVEAAVAGEPVPLGGPKPRTLLALLAVHASRVVPLERLVDAVWGEDPPEQARAAIYTYISTLRRKLAAADGADVIVRTGGGYRLEAALDQIDLHVFLREITAARRARAEGRLAQAVTHFENALGLWRGAALGGAQGTWADNERARLEGLKLAALEDRFDAELALGGSEALVADLTTAVAEEPLRERLRAQLMLALHRTGRQADALECYREGRRALLDELGLEPSAVLRDAHEQVLRAEAEPVAAAADEEDVEPVRSSRTPSQLPFDIADFTGRTVEVATLNRRLAEEATGSRLCAIFGKPGAGKSTLAMHVAHRVREHFPDGQLYVSLRGTRTVRQEPAEVLAGFLRALGVADPAIPDEADERARHYRTMLADRRILVVLDDVADEKQVRPLLPGGHTSAVLVTSRERLSALDGATHLDLRVLAEDEAVHLLDRVVGGGRVAAEPSAAQEIVRLCGRLPLAVRIAGARLAARHRWQLGRLADRLRVQQRVLQELSIGDLEVRGSLALSYDGLPERERMALRRLGLLDLSSFGGWVVAPLLGCSATDAEDVVERLVDAQLLDVSTSDASDALRYQIHDLTRAFARERGEAEETAETIRTATARAAECWLGLVEVAGRRMPHATLDFERPGLLDRYLDEAQVDEIVADPEAWFDAEQSGLVGVVERVSELDLTDVATRLAAALCSSRFSVRNLFGQWYRTHTAALGAARRAGDRLGEARLLAGLGWLRYEQDRFDESAGYYEQALTVYEQAGDRRGLATTRLALSTVQREHGQLTAARTSLEQVLAELELPQDRLALVQARHGLGRVLTEQGELDAGLAACEQACAEYEEIGDQRGWAIALRSVGIVHRAADRLEQAEHWSARAVEVLSGLGNVLASAYAVQALAKVRVRQGMGDELRDELLACLDTCNEMQDGFGQALMLRTLGELDLAASRFADARRHLERALQWWDALGLPVWRARTLRDLAAALDGLGESVAADRAWAEALGVFQLHGCREAQEPRRVPASGPRILEIF